MLGSGFPPEPKTLKGRDSELRTLTRSIRLTAPTRLALVGAGGSGKTLLAAALGHRLARFFGGRVHWFRVGSWDVRTLTEMFALAFGTRLGDRRVPALKAFFSSTAPRLIVLDNHEDDAAMAEFLELFSSTPVTFVITARRCLLAGVFIYPVTAPLVTSGKSAFPRVASLTRLLRWNPLALDIADGIVSSGAMSARALGELLERKGVGRVHAIAHEDELPEVLLLVAWAFQRLRPVSRRVLSVLAHVEGDHVDLESLASLCGARDVRSALEPLLAWHLVQEPLRGRYTLHAVVRHAVRARTTFPSELIFEHYVGLLERHPERLRAEQTHLFGAMDHAHRTSNLGAMLRVEELLSRL